jgi:hypothetical protein
MLIFLHFLILSYLFSITLFCLSYAFYFRTSDIHPHKVPITNTRPTCSYLFAHTLMHLPKGSYNFPLLILIRAAHLLTSSVHTHHPWEVLRRGGGSSSSYKWRGHVIKEPGRNTDLASPRYMQHVVCLAFCHKNCIDSASDVGRNVQHVFFTVHPFYLTVSGGNKFRKKRQVFGCTLRSYAGDTRWSYCKVQKVSAETAGSITKRNKFAFIPWR